MIKIKHEVAIVLGLIAGAGEVVLTTFPHGQLHDIIAVVLPVIAALGIRAQVVPVDKIIGDLPTLLPLVTRLEGVVATATAPKPAKVAAPRGVRTHPKAGA
jgi:hypothetical protein